MKILAVSDIESKYIWDHFDPAVFKSVELIISCGDLKASYLSYLVTMIPAPLFYVCGNHDTDYTHRPPEGCVCIDGELVRYRGLRIAGLGGAMGEGQGAIVYTEAEMERRSRKLESRIKKAGGLDIFVTHAAPLGRGDGPSQFHRGFSSFCRIDDTYSPKYHFFGHYHLSGSPVNNRAVSVFGATTCINATGYRIIEL